jgi:hypothetical protein
VLLTSSDFNQLSSRSFTSPNAEVDDAPVVGIGARARIFESARNTSEYMVEVHRWHDAQWKYRTVPPPPM